MHTIYVNFIITYIGYREAAFICIICAEGENPLNFYAKAQAVDRMWAPLQARALYHCIKTTGLFIEIV